jgi:hypothetical protein
LTAFISEIQSALLWFLDAGALGVFLVRLAELRARRTDRPMVNQAIVLADRHGHFGRGSVRPFVRRLPPLDPSLAAATLAHCDPLVPKSIELFARERIPNGFPRGMHTVIGTVIAVRADLARAARAHFRVACDRIAGESLSDRVIAFERGLVSAKLAFRPPARKADDCGSALWKSDSLAATHFLSPQKSAGARLNSRAGRLST